MFVSPYQAAMAGLFGSALALACNPASYPGDENIALSEASGSSGANTAGSSGGGGETDACEDACEAGAALCVDDGVARCVDAGACLRWSDPEPCPKGQICDDGACAVAQGFRSQAEAWAVPTGGRAGVGFFTGAGEPTLVGEDSWRLVDLDGDGALDLVVTSSAYKSGEGTVTRTQGFPGAPFWEIFRGGGQGFASTPSAWWLPVGVGLLERGLVSLDGSPTDLADHAWALRDLNGDHKPDLVVTGRGDFDGLVLPLGAPDTPRWDVYLNQGDRFAAAPTAVLLPQGPDALLLTAPQGAVSGEGGLIWSLADLNGDSRNDLVISARHDWTKFSTPGFPDSPHWDVHLGWEQGFQPTPIAWALPQGGSLAGGFIGGPGGLASAGEAPGDQLWSVLDLDGDGSRELVVTGSLLSPQQGAQVLGADATPHWRVFRVEGDGFSPVYETFAVPAEGGGALGRGFYSLSGGQTTAGTLDAPFDVQGWELLDLDGDRRLDLVVTNEARAQDTVYIRQALGGEADPRWDVYPGTPAGFLTPRPWPMPLGGIAGRGFLWGRGQLGPVPQVDGSVLWELGDLDGDRKPELIVTAHAVPPDQGTTWFWRVPGFLDGDSHWQVRHQSP